jgi:hypothetical protein
LQDDPDSALSRPDACFSILVDRADTKRGVLDHAIRRGVDLRQPELVAGDGPERSEAEVSGRTRELRD